MSSTLPLISVIIPAYNTEAYLARCLDSVLSQTLTDFELLLIDDGSTDGTAAIADRYAEADSRVKVIHKENGGVSSARNRGLEVARGEFITFVDSDDTVQPTYLEKLYTALCETGADISVVNWGGWGGWLAYRLSEPRKVFSPDTLSDLNLLYTCWAHMFRRSSMTVLRFAEDIQYAEDTLFTVQNFCGSSRNRLAVLEDHLYEYDRSNPHAATAQGFRKERISEIAAYDRMQNTVSACPTMTNIIKKNKADHLWDLYCMMVTSGGSKRYPVEAKVLKQLMRNERDLLRRYLTPRAKAVCTLCLHCEWLSRPLIQARERKKQRKSKGA